MSVGIVGGGIAGLAALWELRKQGVEATLYEAGPGCGGKLVAPTGRPVAASPLGTTPIPAGADAFLARVPDALDLAAELGIVDQLISPAAGQAQIWLRRDGSRDGAGRLVTLEQPHVLGIPLDPQVAARMLGPEAASDLQRDLARVDADPVQPDETIGSLVRRRLGDRIHEMLVDPLLGAINAGDTDRLSLHASSPQLLAGALRSPSLVRGLDELRASAPAHGSVFQSFRDGPGVLAIELAERMSDHIQVMKPIRRVRQIGDRLDLIGINGDLEGSHSGIVLATPAAAEDLLASAAPDVASLASIPTAVVTLVTLVWGNGSVPRPLSDLDPAISGFLVPRSDPLRITACSWASNKWPHLAHEGQVVARISVGHVGDPDTPALADGALARVVLDDLEEVVGAVSAPTVTRVSRWPGAFPQYEVGHLDRVASARAVLAERNIALAGMSYDGIGIPASIRSGRAAARQIAATLAPA